MGYPLKRVVLIADCGLLSVNNLDELAALQAALKAPGRLKCVDWGISGRLQLRPTGWRALNAVRLAKITGDIPQNVNFAIHANVSRTFLGANSVDYDVGPAKSVSAPTDGNVGEQRGSLPAQPIDHRA